MYLFYCLKGTATDTGLPQDRMYQCRNLTTMGKEKCHTSNIFFKSS